MHKNRHLFAAPIFSTGLLLLLWLSMHAAINQAAVHQAIASPSSAESKIIVSHFPSTLNKPATQYHRQTTHSYSPTIARLLIDGIPALNVANAHLGKQKLSHNGRYLAVPLVPTGVETVSAGKIIVIDNTSRQVVFEVPGHAVRWANKAAALSEPDPSTAEPSTAGAQSIAGQLGVERVWADGNSVLTRINLYESADGGLGKLIARQVSTEALPLAEPALSAAAYQASAASLQMPAYPESIRVLHHADNQCRDVPVNEVSVIPFEEYVARVVSSEVPASWSLEALKAQAVAVRTYAWYQIQVGRDSYDVTDWANFQYMCDEVYEPSERAVNETAGLYLTSIDEGGGSPIVAMYSAENSHPTLTNPNVPYLQSVPDLYSLGRTRSGHGYGLSQWGAQRRALDGHDFGQILGHYYSGVHLRNGLSPTDKFASFVEPAGHHFFENAENPEGKLASVGLQWRLITSSPDIFSSTEVSNGVAVSNTVNLSSTVNLTGTAQFTQPATLTIPAITVNITTSRALTYVQMLTTALPISQAVSLTETASITETFLPTQIVTYSVEVITTTQLVTGTIAYISAEGLWAIPSQLVDGDIVSITFQAGSEVLGGRRLVVDHTAPEPPQLTAIGSQPVMDLPRGVNSAAISSAIVISTNQAEITGTAPPATQIATSLGWSWQGEELIHTENSGEIIADAKATGGRAWQAQAGLHEPGIWYGPYTNVLTPERAYRAIFWMHTPLTATESPRVQMSPEILARLDVTDSEGRKVLGLRDLRVGDFQHQTFAGNYTPVSVDFYIFEPTQGIEFRVAWFGNRTLTLDRVEVWTLPTLPVDQNFSLSLDLGHGDGERVLSVAAFDPAGNVSEPYTTTLLSVDMEPPILNNLNIPSKLAAGVPIAASVQAMDPFSGLDFVSSALILTGASITITETAAAPTSSNIWQRQTLMFDRAQELEAGTYNVQIIVTDLAGNRAATEPRQIIIEPPLTNKQFVPFFK